MSSSAVTPAPSALLPSHNSDSPSTTPPSTTSSDPVVKPQRKPLLRLELRDLSSPGAQSFLRLLHASIALQDAVDTVLTQLYKGLAQHCIPGTRSVTLILRQMDGVAYTTGKDLDSDHKEIHFNTNYISHVPESRLKEEMLGVIVHEMVHCWQHNGYGTAPGGLIEGIADWVRLKAGFSPPHWKRHTDNDWDAGYERTGYFLEWLEQKCGNDIVRTINLELQENRYEEKAFWKKCCGSSVHELWEEYKKFVEDSDKK